MIRRIDQLNRQLSREQDEPGRRQLLDGLWETEQRSVRVTEAFEEPSYSFSTQLVSLSVLQSKLCEGELLIEYQLGPSRSFALAVTDDRIVPYLLASRHEIEAGIVRHLQAIHAKGRGEVAGRLAYSLLLQPIALIPASRRLIIVTDGSLSREPFDAAIDDQGRYLVETHVVAFAPSATAFCLLSNGRQSTTRRVAMLGVGGARYSTARISSREVRGAGALFGLVPPQFSPLTRSRAEVTDVSASGDWSTRLLTGDDATESVLKSLSLPDFDVLHFSLHSAIDRDFPDRSGLVFTSRSSDQDDDLLQAREIRGLKLNAELVTLSACNGASGTSEGIVGTDSLAEAFLMAGAHSVMASIWPADDAFTAALMRRFYANLHRGHDKAEALTFAKRELLKEWGTAASPEYWAGFRIIGDTHGTIPGGPLEN